MTVGSHDVSIGFADRARFTTHPPGGKGALTRNAGCGSCVRLNYSFSQNERAAYAMGDVDLPDDTLGIAFDVQDDGSNARLRIAVRNSINEDTRLDATRLDAAGMASRDRALSRRNRRDPADVDLRPAAKGRRDIGREHRLTKRSRDSRGPVGN